MMTAPKLESVEVSPAPVASSDGGGSSAPEQQKSQNNQSNGFDFERIVVIVPLVTELLAALTLTGNSIKGLISAIRNED
jgi:hypothetical protein